MRLSVPGHKDLRKIVVLNPKGGCGKSTLATNLAGYLASSGHSVAIMDFDPQGSAMRWLKIRPGNSAPIRGIAAFDVRSSAHNPQASALSGGNLQKFVIGRELDRNPKLVVINQPTWGVDAGAAALIRQALVDLARAGAAVLVISQDLDEIFDLADRIAVISRGRLSPAKRAAETDLERIGLMMAGALDSTSHASTSAS